MSVPAMGAPPSTSLPPGQLAVLVCFAALLVCLLAAGYQQAPPRSAYRVLRKGEVDAAEAASEMELQPVAPATAQTGSKRLRGDEARQRIRTGGGQASMSKELKARRSDEPPPERQFFARGAAGDVAYESAVNAHVPAGACVTLGS